MKKSKKLNIVLEKRIEIAAALSLFGQSPGVFDAGGLKQSFLFVEGPELQKGYKELEDGKWPSDTVAHIREMIKLYDFIVDSIEQNAEYDLSEEIAKEG